MTQTPIKKGPGAKAAAPAGSVKGADSGVKQPDTAGAELVKSGDQAGSPSTPAGGDGASVAGASPAAAPSALPASDPQAGADLDAGTIDVSKLSFGAVPRYIYGVEISATRDGFRRAGRAWYREPTFVAEDELDEDQIAALLAEPNIRIVAARREAPAEGGLQ